MKEKMKLAVLGATGRTGKEVVQQALEAGHSVTAVVRDSSKMTISHENLKVVKGNIFDKSSLSGIFPDHDAIVSCLGFPRNPQPVTGYTESFSAIASAMRETTVNRVVTMTAWYTDTSTATNSGFLVNWVLIPFIRPILNNMLQMEKSIESSCSDLDYTVVRPPGLSNGLKTGLPMKVAEDYLVNTNAGVNRMSCADVASFMLSCLGTQDYNKKMVAIVPEK